MTAQSPPSVREVVRELAADALRFGRAELNLVRAEGTRAGKRGAIAAVLLGIAATFGFLVLIFLLGAGAAAIGEVTGMPWLGWLCIAGLALVISGIAGLSGVARLRRAIREGKQVGSVVKEDLEWLRELPRQNANGS
jgi:cytochrome c biogenesis protein CcdA